MYVCTVQHVCTYVLATGNMDSIFHMYCGNVDSGAPFMYEAEVM
jgi:hypothetical protein